MRYLGIAGLFLLLLPHQDLRAQIRYTVQPMASDSITRLRVTVSAPGEADGTTRFALPEDRFGVAQMWQWIEDVAAGPGTDLHARGSGVYQLAHPPGADAEVSYTIAYDPVRAGFTPFGPSVDGAHFHFFGSQWMARVGPAKGSHEVRRDVEIALQRDAWGGSWASSFGLGPGPHRVRVSDYDLDYSVIAGGDYRTETSDCQGRPIVVAVHGKFEIPDADLFYVAGRIACAQRAVFGDYEWPSFTIFVTQRDDLEAGAPLLNGFTAFLESSTSEEELMGLLAHEMIHTWLPRSARLVEKGAPDAPENRTRWFHEGFTEYLARLALVQEGLLPRSWMLDRTNDDLERLAFQPYRTLSLDGIEAAGREGRYTAVHHRLHYVRGALLALNWDTRVRRASGGERSIVDPIRLVVETARANGGTVGVNELCEIFERFGVDAERDVERYLRGGVPLQPEPNAFGPSYELVTRELPSFEPGFDVLHWLATGEVADVTPGGPADRAGMRDGMRIVRSGNASPWHGRWNPSEPSVFLVQVDGDDGESTEPRRFEVNAAGSPIEVERYEPRR